MEKGFPLDVDLIKDSLSKEKWWSRFVFWSAAAFLGLLAVSFAKLCEWANDLFMKIYEFSPYLPFLVCPLGFLFIVELQKRMFPCSEGSGIPQVIASLKSGSTLLRDRLLSVKIVVGKVLCTFLALLCGASVGREGPSVHIGASLFNFLGHYARFTKFERRQGLVIAGAAAGIAAAFNAPLAGIVFAIEELKGSFEERTSGLMLSAVILSGLVALSIVGHYSYFGTISVGLKGAIGVAAIAVISLVGGFLGGSFSRGILEMKSRLSFTPKKKKFLIPISLGLILASIGFFSQGKAFGTGYHQAQMLLDSSDGYVLLFPVFKIAATMASYLTGIAGGLFAPSLAIGAGLGNLLHPLFQTLPREALLLLGMVSFLSGVIRAPVTAFVVVYEMTINHFLLLPLMAVSFISAGVSKLVCPTPLYMGLAEQYAKKYQLPE